MDDLRGKKVTELTRTQVTHIHKVLRKQLTDLHVEQFEINKYHTGDTSPIKEQNTSDIDDVLKALSYL